MAVACHREARVQHPFIERRQDRRADPILATLVDVAIAYRENLGGQVAEAFMRETGVPAALAQRVLERSASRRTTVPRRRASRPVWDTAADRRQGDGVLALAEGRPDAAAQAMPGASAAPTPT